MLKITDLKAGKIILLEGSIYEVLEYSHTKLGRGGAIVKVKIKDLKNGTIIEKTLKGQEKIEEANLEVVPCQFLYSSGNNFYFMNSKTFDQFSLPENKIGYKKNFLNEGANVEVLFLGGEPINIKLPIKMDFKVIEAEPGVKGDSASAVTKEVVIETGFKLQAPLFIKKGDIIKVDTRSGEYLERI